MHWYIPLEFNIVESVSWLLLLSNTHVERPPIPTGFSYPPLRGEVLQVLLLTPTPVLIKQVYRRDMVQLSKKKLYLTFTAILSKISHDTFTTIRVISSSTACCSVFTGKSTASIHCYKMTTVNIISIILASSLKIGLVKNLNRAKSFILLRNPLLSGGHEVHIAFTV